jgi:hypothetical protein
MLKGYGLQATLSAFTAAAAEGAKTSKAIVSTAERNLRIKPRALPKQNGFVPADTSIYDKEA